MSEMSKSSKTNKTGKMTKASLITAALLMIIGFVVFTGAMAALDWDFSKLSTVKYETNTYEISENFDSISIDTDTADIVLMPSDDGKCKVVCYEEEKERHCAAVQSGTLEISAEDMREWYDHIGISFSSPRITVYLPQTEYSSLLISESTGDIKIPKDFRFEGIDISASTGNVECCACASGKIQIELSTGSITVDGVSAGELNLSVSTGKVYAESVTCEGNIGVSVSTGNALLTDITCQRISSHGSTGNMTLKNVIASESFSIERSTGEVRLDDCDAAEIFIKTDTGDVTGTLLSEKVFIAETDTGSIVLPKTASGGRCEITTDTGDIRIDIS